MMRRPVPLTPALLLTAAHSFAGIRDDRGPGGPGTLSDCFLRETGISPERRRWYPWHTAFVFHCGWWSHYDARARTSSWPLPPTANVRKLARFAEAQDALREAPVPGDLFLFCGAMSGKFLRAGVVASVDERVQRGLETVWRCTTIEGDTDAMMRHSGGEVLRHAREFSAVRGDRFIRWTSIGEGQSLEAAIEEQALRSRVRMYRRAA